LIIKITVTSGSTSIVPTETNRTIFKMYDCLTAEEETKLFLAAMDDYEKHLEDDTVDVDVDGQEEECSSSIHTPDAADGNPLVPRSSSNNSNKVFTEHEVKNNTGNGEDSSIFFIAGRGGETNFHAGNAIFRNRVLQYTHAYVQAGTKGRGKKFARSLMMDPCIDITRNVIFVVRQAYFKKNIQAGKISTQRKNSVLHEHAPRTLDDILSSCKEQQIDANHHLYLTIGEEWIVGIITDLLRTSASKVMGMGSAGSAPYHTIITPQDQPLLLHAPPPPPAEVVMMMPVVMSANNNKRQREDDTRRPCPEISIVPTRDQVMMPMYYHPQQLSYQPFQHHEDCSLSSMSSSDHSSDEDSERSGSRVSASNDMFLPSSYQRQHYLQPEASMMMIMPPAPQQQQQNNKRARLMTMTVTTTTIPAMPATTVGSGGGAETTAVAQSSLAPNQQWWHSSPIVPPAPNGVALPNMTLPWEPVIALNSNSNNNNNTYQYGDNNTMKNVTTTQPQHPVQQQQHPQFYGHGEVWRTQEV
jgi:hypothetical protein